MKTLGFHVDTRYIAAGAGSGFDGQIVTAERDGRTWHDLTDEFGVTWSMPDDQQLYMDISHSPLAEATLKEVETYPFPDGGNPTASPASARRPGRCVERPPTRSRPRSVA